MSENDILYDSSLLISLHNNLNDIIDCNDNYIILIKFNNETYNKKTKIEVMNILENIINHDIEFISWYNGFSYKIGIVLKYKNTSYINIVPFEVYYKLKSNNCNYDFNFPVFLIK